MLFKNKNSVYSYMVVGLGNPGREYESTRHNVGFRVADKLAEDFAVTDFKAKHKALICDCKINNERVLLAKPQTFMNLSGQAVAELAKFYKIPANRIIVIFDDISLPVGKIRVRSKGTHGGHNGMKNILELMATNDIPRIKVGVGEKPNPEYDLKDWVLGEFSADENKLITEARDRALAAACEIITADVTAAMNKFNS